MFRLLIEPVWNRNTFFIVHGRDRPQSFNRTSMESKRFLLMPSFLSASPFNRTSMESKHKTIELNTYPNLTFNRTSMESKQIP